MKYLDQLIKLSKHSFEVDKLAKEYSQDDSGKVSSDEIQALCKVLSGVATTEKLEDLLISPAICTYKEEAIVNYLEGHALDERRHHDNLSQYLSKTFNFSKDHKSISDYLFYEGIIPFLLKYLKRKPVRIYMLIYFFEKLSLYFYDSVNEFSKKKGLTKLSELIVDIKKDESRHIKGMSLMIDSEKDVLTNMDKWIFIVIAKIISLDINVSGWAIHNKKMRKSFKTLKINPEDFMGRVDETFNHLKNDIVFS